MMEDSKEDLILPCRLCLLFSATSLSCPGLVECHISFSPHGERESYLKNNRMIYFAAFHSTLPSVILLTQCRFLSTHAKTQEHSGECITCSSTNEAYLNEEVAN